MSKSKKLYALYIEWEDPTVHDGWTDAEAVTSRVPMQCKSCGFLVHEDKDYLRLTLALSDANQIMDPFIIPKKLIKRRRKVRF